MRHLPRMLLTPKSKTKIDLPLRSPYPRVQHSLDLHLPKRRRQLMVWLSHHHRLAQHQDGIHGCRAFPQSSPQHLIPLALPPLVSQHHSLQLKKYPILPVQILQEMSYYRMVQRLLEMCHTRPRHPNQHSQGSYKVRSEGCLRPGDSYQLVRSRHSTDFANGECLISTITANDVNFQN